MTGKKRAILFFLIMSASIAGILYFYYYLRKTNPASPDTGTTGTFTPTHLPIESWIIPGAVKYPYRYQETDYLLILADPGDNPEIVLVPNFTEKEFAANLVIEKSCRIAVNAGFYREDNSPLGLFIIGDEKYGENIISPTHNGYLYRFKNGGVTGISGKIPGNASVFDFIFQSGPFFPLGNYELKIRNDEKARRSLAVTDVRGKIYLGVLIGRDNEYSGPFLSSLPLMLQAISHDNGLDLKYALNLDGGSASFFYTKDTNGSFILGEIKPIGSLICVK